jgi:hypothetical protein
MLLAVFPRLENLLKVGSFQDEDYGRS